MSGIVAELSELIHLRQYAQRSFYTNKKRQIEATGVHRSRFLGRGMDFSEVRNYQAGDEIRHMEWRVTARTGRPYIKLYQEEKERTVMLFCDFSSSMFFGTKVALKSVIAARLAALISWTTIKQADKIGGLIYSENNYHEFLPRRNRSILPLLSAISQETQQNQQKKPQSILLSDEPFPLSLPLERLQRTIKPGTLIVFISDFYFLNQETERLLSRVAKNSPIIAYSISDPMELSPPIPGYYPVTNGQQQFLCNMTQKDILENYADYCNQRQASLNALFKRLKIKEVQVTSAADLPLIVQKTFPRRSCG